MIKKDGKVYIIAEIGMNHDGSFGNAKCLIRAAADAGVNAVKFQMHIAEEEMLESAPNPPYFTDETRWEYFSRTAFSDQQWSLLKDYAHEKDVDFIVSPFSVEAVRRLVEIGVDAFKIASGEVNNPFLLRAVQLSGVPVVLSTGMSTYKELDEAMNVLNKGNAVCAILQCSSRYPCEPQAVGLNVMEDLQCRYPDISIGLSDHTFKNYASFAAVTKGALVVERHFTLTKNGYGSDAKFSLLPEEMQDLVCGIRDIEVMLTNDIVKDNIDVYKIMRYTFCKSIVAAVDIPKGTVLVFEHLTAKKPAAGILASKLSDVIGKKVKKAILKNELIQIGDFE